MKAQFLSQGNTVIGDRHEMFMNEKSYDSKLHLMTETCIYMIPLQQQHSSFCL